MKTAFIAASNNQSPIYPRISKGQKQSLFTSHIERFLVDFSPLLKAQVIILRARFRTLRERVSLCKRIIKYQTKRVASADL
jgi:hypothetical protein